MKRFKNILYYTDGDAASRPALEGMFRRLAVSLFAEWRSRDTKRKRATMTDFQSEMGAEHASYAMRFITTRYPSFGKRSGVLLPSPPGPSSTT